MSCKVRVTTEVEVGDKIKFQREKQRYTVRACDKRFIIAVKPFNARKTFQYTIVDLKEKVRGADNWYCKYDYENDDLTEAMRLLNEGKIYSTHRSKLKLDIERIDKGKKNGNE